jgi:hypothetical protein
MYEDKGMVVAKSFWLWMELVVSVALWEGPLKNHRFLENNPEWLSQK